MLTPYDWQEGIGNRASYIENKLAQGAPILAISLPEGILVFTYRRQSRKIFEVYDRLLFTAIGQQNDIESLRTAAIDFAHQEGYQRSEEDVTIQRLVNALSTPIKRAFGDFGVAPIVARCLFAEISANVEDDRFYVLDYDGDYQLSRGVAVVTGDEDVARKMKEAVAKITETDPIEVLVALKAAWLAGFEGDEEAPELTDLQPEAVLMARSTIRENRFTWLEGAEDGR